MEHTATRCRLHAGAEAVLLGAMALLGLVGLLHRAVLRSSPSGLGVGSFRRPLKARKRAGTPRGAWRVVVRRMIWPRRKECQTARGGSRARGRRSRTDTPQGYAGIALRRPARRCYPSRALGAGKHVGGLDSPRSEGSGERVARPSERDPRRTRPPFPDRGRWPASRFDDPSNQPSTPRDPSTEWTQSRSGEPPLESSRCRCRPPITRPGCAIPRSSMSMTSASGSPSPTASPRIGWRPATAR